MSEFFPYRLDRRWTPMFTAMRVGREDGVTLTDDGQFRATFGFLHVETSVDNIDHTKVTGPHRWYTAVGARLSFADDGLTFGTNHHLGLCIEFVDKIPKVVGPRPHSALWVSVADPDGLATALGC
jgi:hypothetical protein